MTNKPNRDIDANPRLLVVFSFLAW
jgi:hypothetical protein